MARFVLVLGCLAACDYAFRLDELPTPPDAAVLSSWGSPRPLAELNSDATEGDPSLTEDGLEIYFASTRLSTGNQVYRATRANRADPFGEPVLVPELVDVAPQGFVTADGLAFYYNANGDIHMVSRPTRADAFASPIRLFELSSGMPDSNIRVAPGGLFATVSRIVSERDEDLFLYARTSTEQPWAEVRELLELNTPTRDAAASFADSGGLVVVLDSDRKTMSSRSDLYLATRATLDEPFVIEELVTLNTEVANEREPHLMPDLSEIVFVRQGDLWVSTRLTARPL